MKMFDRNARIVDARSYEYELSEKMKDANDEIEKHYAESGKDSTYYVLLGKWKGLNDALTLLESYINGGRL